MVPNRRGLKWTNSELSILQRLYAEGKSISEIASQLQRDTDAVVYRLISSGIIGFADGYIPARHGLPWNNNELEMLTKEWNASKTIDQIALAHQRQKNAILYRLVELRLIDILDRSVLERYKDNDSTAGQPIGVSGQVGIGLSNGGGEVDIENTGDHTVNENPSFVGAITGRNDAIYLKNKYQRQLEKLHTAIGDYVANIKKSSNELTEIWARIPAIKKNIEAHEKERSQLYTSLNNLLTKETDFEDKMWKTTQKGRTVKSITVKQKFKESDVDEMRFDTMQDYIKQYPEYASKSTFRKILENIEQKEDAIRKETEKYNGYISEYNFRLNTFEKEIQRADDKFEDYMRIRKDGEEKLKNSRYNQSILKTFRSEQASDDANLVTLHHRIDQFRNTLNIVKGEHSQNKRKAFVDMEF